MSPGRLQPDAPEPAVVRMTKDEAIATAIRESRPGDQIAIHADDCDSCADGDPYDDKRCRCEPMLLTIGAVA